MSQLVTGSIILSGTTINGIASQEEAEAVTAGDKLMTAERTGQAIEELAPPVLTQEQVEDDTNTTFGLVSGQRLAEHTNEAFNVSGSAPKFACRAWVNFNGTGTVAIRASGNVSSITDNGNGDYTVNFTTAMPDADYSVVTNTVSQLENTEGATVTIKAANNTSNPDLLTSSAVRLMRRGTFNEVRSDGTHVHVAIFR